MWSIKWVIRKATGKMTDVQMTPDGRVSRNEAARFLGYKPKTLAEWQRLGIGPASIRVGGRRFYHLDELREYADGTKQIRRDAA
uniref:Putative DNA binding, helix-turn-helix domain containing protein n=1 Tax=viral metagenome TaxID=1070528 RepID=A0A6M3XVM6_9ZZZZ